MSAAYPPAGAPIQAVKEVLVVPGGQAFDPQNWFAGPVEIGDRLKVVPSTSPPRLSGGLILFDDLPEGAYLLEIDAWTAGSTIGAHYRVGVISNYNVVAPFLNNFGYRRLVRVAALDEDHPWDDAVLVLRLRLPSRTRSPAGDDVRVETPDGIEVPH